MTKIGVMGGMFDPVHNGHLSSALAALEEFGLDEVRMIPCGSPVHRKSAMGSDQDRIAMLKLAIEGETGLVVDERECKSKSPSYTISTLEALKQEKPQTQLFLLLGVDAFNTLTTWHRWQEIFLLTHLIVVTRPGWSTDISDELSDFIEARQVNSFEEMNGFQQGRVLYQSFTPMMLGSSEVRQRISQQKSARFLLPDTVWQYIKTNKLYT